MSGMPGHHITGNGGDVLQCYFCLSFRGPSNGQPLYADTVVAGFACCVEHMHYPTQPQRFPLNPPTAQRIEVKRDESPG